jgi:ADP-ribose pyrophosphatase YjhB (NUDIX family)
MVTGNLPSCPIVCIDILPIQRSPSDKINRIGLIKRHPPHEGDKWCTVGGRLLFGESLQDGIWRQLRDTLGSDIQIARGLDIQPLYVAQYSPSLEAAEGFDAVDPRKHAVALTYLLEIEGVIAPQNEALDFKWCTLSEFRTNEHIGLGQERVIEMCLERFEGLNKLR